MNNILKAISLLLFMSMMGFAQIDLSGAWSARNHEDLEGMLLGDYTGIPINDEARARADSWLPSRQAMPERQCILYTTHYVVRGPQNLQISSEVDPISGRVVARKEKPEATAMADHEIPGNVADESGHRDI